MLLFYATIIGILFIPVFLIWFFRYRLVILKISDIENTLSLFKIIRSNKGTYGLSKWGKRSSSSLLGMKYSKIIRVNDETFVCERGGLSGIYSSTKRKMIAPVCYESISFDGNRFVATKGGVVSVFTDRGYRVVE